MHTIRKNVKFNIHKADSTRTNIIIMEYEFNGIEFEACLMHKNGVFLGGLRRSVTPERDYDIGEIEKEEGELLLELAREHEAPIPDVFMEAIKPFAAFGCPQCGGKLYNNHCSNCEQRGQ